jgi:hypothetical protein
MMPLRDVTPPDLATTLLSRDGQMFVARVWSLREHRAGLEQAKVELRQAIAKAQELLKILDTQ